MGNSVARVSGAKAGLRSDAAFSRVGPHSFWSGPLANSIGAASTRHITEEIPAKVSADSAYKNAKQHSDKQNARIEHDKALARVMTAVLKDDTELFKKFSDNESFRRWLTDTVFALTYE